MTVSRGHVVALRRRGAGVVIHANETYVWVCPLGGRNGQPNHRAEVRVDFEDVSAMGIAFAHPVVRCQHAVKIERHRLVSPTPLGVTPLSLMVKIMASLRREISAQHDEARLMFHNDNARNKSVMLVG